MDMYPADWFMFVRAQADVIRAEEIEHLLDLLDQVGRRSRGEVVLHEQVMEEVRVLLSQRLQRLSGAVNDIESLTG